MTDFETMTDAELRQFKSTKWHEQQLARSEMAMAEVYLQALRAASDPDALKRLMTDALLADDLEQAVTYREQYLAVIADLEARARAEGIDPNEGGPVSATIDVPPARGTGGATTGAEIVTVGAADVQVLDAATYMDRVAEAVEAAEDAE